MGDGWQRNKFKVEAGYRLPSCFHVSITYKQKHLIQCTSVSTRQKVTRHWIVGVLSDSPVSPCCEIPNDLLGVGFRISWNEAKVANRSLVVTPSKQFSWSRRWRPLSCDALQDFLCLSSPFHTKSKNSVQIVYGFKTGSATHDRIESSILFSSHHI